MNVSADVVVVGAGPAGAVAAMVLARRGVDVVLIDRPSTKPFRIGEGLPPAARPVLESLGLLRPFEGACHLPSFGNRALWPGPNISTTDFLFHPHGHGWHLDRPVFDEMLVRQAETAGARVLLNTSVTSAEAGADVRLQITSAAGASGRLVASWAIDCSGRSGVVARCFGAHRIRFDQLVAVAVMFGAPQKPDTDSTTLVEAVRDGWWYSARIPGDRRVAAFFTDGDLPAARRARNRMAWLAGLGETKILKKLVLEPEYAPTGEMTVFPADSSRLEHAVGTRWLAAGDTAASFDPLSSQGILSAVSGGRRAASALLEYRDGVVGALSDYAREVSELYQQFLSRRREQYAAVRSWPDSAFWVRRSRTHQS